MNYPTTPPFSHEVDPAVLAEYLKKSGLRYRLCTNSYLLNCPLCGKDKLYIHKKGYFTCFVCKDTEKFRGKVEYALSKLLDKPVREIIQELYGIGPVQYTCFLDIQFTWAPFGDVLHPIEEEVPIQVELPGILFPVDYVSLGQSQFEPGLRYLLSRGVTPELIRKYNIKYSPREKRVILPVYRGTDLIGWQGRYIGETTIRTSAGEVKYRIPKIVTSEGLSGGHYFMFQNNTSSPHLILTEGPFDALMADKCGGNVAAMGKGVSQPQIETILKWGHEKVYIGLDPDAQEDIQRIIQAIREKSSKPVTFYLLQPPLGKKDLGECSQEEVYQQFITAEPLALPHLFIYFRNSNVTSTSIQ